MLVYLLYLVAKARGCTGWFDRLEPKHGIQHDGPTCLVHEK